MSLIAFQLAFADLTASADFCDRVAEDAEAALAGRDLTPLEVRRLASAAAQKGMMVNVSLYRYNRFTALRQVIPGTVHLLGDAARAIVDKFWAATLFDRNHRKEVDRFADYLRREMDAGLDVSPYLPEVLDYELIRYDLATMPRSRIRQEVAETRERWPDGPLRLHPLLEVAVFAHDPNALLTWLAEQRPVPFPALEEKVVHLLIDCRADMLKQYAFDATWAGHLADFRAGREVPMSMIDAMVEYEILVPGRPADADAPSPIEAEAEPQPA